MNSVSLIAKKKRGEKLSRSEFDFIISSLLENEIPDYQISALLMAIYFKGLDEDEIYDLTDLMLHSGKILSFRESPVWDKHSTGGVGDKVSIILAPILASLGINVSMISGRSLGYTGGTIDKLESIPGFTAEQPIDRLKKLIAETGFFIVTQSNDIAPADKRLYALRDVTATVDSIPLIVASILSKKFAEGIDGMVLDVKCGKGAFMKTIGQARALAKCAELMGVRFGNKVKTIISDMNQPLGLMVGNSLEIIESIEFLKGRYQSDLKEIVFTIAQLIMEEVGLTADLDREICSGRPLERLQKFIRAQNGNDGVIENYLLLPSASIKYELKSPDDGWIEDIDARQVGEMVTELGGGRMNLGDSVDYRVGIEFLKKVGDRVERKEPIAIIHLGDQNQRRIIEQYKLITLSSDSLTKKPVIIETS